MCDIISQIERFCPYNEQEAADRQMILKFLKSGRDVFTRENPAAHMTASAWVVNETRDKVLMAWHNLYRSWSWLGGHADGEQDLAAVALREVKEESGIQKVRLLSQDIFSLEVLSVAGHEKKGRYLSSHLHLNVTYLLEASEKEPLRSKPDENSAVGWMGLSQALEASDEPWFRDRIYKKLNEKLAFGWTNA